LNKKQDRKNKNKKKKSEILDKYKTQMDNDLILQDKPVYDLLKEKKVVNKEKTEIKNKTKIYEK
jgi:hypothetical protein